jgi:hypothetical protein
VNDIHVFGCLWPSHGDGEGTGYREVGDTHSNIGGTSEALSADINPSSGQSYYYSTDENVPSGGDRSDSVVCRHSCFGILIVAVFVTGGVLGPALLDDVHVYQVLNMHVLDHQLAQQCHLLILAQFKLPADALGLRIAVPATITVQISAYRQHLVECHLVRCRQPVVCEEFP